MKEYIPIKLTKDELDDISALVDFNHATDYKEAFGIKLGKNSIEEYIVMDSYCKNPDCTCKDIVIDFVERNDEKIIGTFVLYL